MANIPFISIDADALAEKVASKIKMLLEPSAPPSEQINNKEAAEILGCKVSYLAQLRHRNEIPYYKSGREISYKRSEIEAYRDGKRVPTNSERVEMARNAQRRLKHGK